MFLWSSTSCSLQYNSASAAAVSVGEENDAEISTFLGDIRRRKHSSAPAMEKVKSTNAPVKRIAMFQGPSDDSNKEEPVRADNEKDLEAFKRVHMLTGQEISSLQGSATRGPGIVVYDTWTSNEYDRRGDIGATCNRLSHVLAQHIKEELNTFKMEMEVHEDSKIYTHFF
ncbi:hypothetical protein B0I37DRAFT_375816 [Chaetomium sp. MPI-CAGE-AT-0009]|nr:hypothetical protein B0I37DRAFT_375816 [Chaetomium sp. MPI-CAGE-AT-0009]